MDFVSRNGLRFVFWVSLHVFCMLTAGFDFKIYCLNTNLSEYHQGVKQFGSRPGLIFFLVLIRVQTVCKGYQHMRWVKVNHSIIKSVCDKTLIDFALI